MRNARQQSSNPSLDFQKTCYKLKYFSLYLSLSLSLDLNFKKENCHMNTFVAYIGKTNKD